MENMSAERDFKVPDFFLEKEIIIVGAGIAGLFCAEELRKYGFHNIAILEASSKLGGRLQTKYVHSQDGEDLYWFDKGARRISRGSNCIFEFATNNKLLNENAPDYSVALKNLKTVYSADEEKIICDLVYYFSQLYYLPKDCEEIFQSKEFSDKFKDHDERLLKYFAKGVYNWHCGLVYEYSFLPAEVKGGYFNLLNAFMEDLPIDWVLGDLEVIKIDWTEVMPGKHVRWINDQKIKVFCRRKTDCYEAHHVIVTVPLGYLKRNVKSLFVPSLPEDKIEAIKSLDFITLNKILLEFVNPFWKIPDVFHVIWNETLDNLFGYEHDATQDKRNWVHCITHFEYDTDNPKILVAYIWNEGAEIMETLSSHEVVISCMKLLAHLLKKPLPMPTRLIRTKWYSNELYCGSLPYDRTRNVEGDVSKIAESVLGGVKGQTPVILFAGDATNKDDLACAHGAAATGIRAAKTLHDFYLDKWKAIVNK